MKQKIANYTVIIEKQKRLGTNKSCYSAQVPTLGIATEADTLEKVEKEIKSLIEFHIDCLDREGDGIPVEAEYPLITRLQAVLPPNFKIAY